MDINILSLEFIPSWYGFYVDVCLWENADYSPLGWQWLFFWFCNKESRKAGDTQMHSQIVTVMISWYMFPIWLFKRKKPRSIFISLFYYFFLFFNSFSFFGCPIACGVPGQGSDPSHSWDLSCSCSITGSLTHCAEPRIEPAFEHSQDTTDPIAPQREPPSKYF